MINGPMTIVTNHSIHAWTHQQIKPSSTPIMGGWSEENLVVADDNNVSTKVTQTVSFSGCPLKHHVTKLAFTSLTFSSSVTSWTRHQKQVHRSQNDHT